MLPTFYKLVNIIKGKQEKPKWFELHDIQTLKNVKSTENNFADMVCT